MRETKAATPETLRAEMTRALDDIQSDHRKHLDVLELLGRIEEMQIPAEALPAMAAACREAAERIRVAMERASDLDWSSLNSLQRVAESVATSLERRPR